MQSPLPSGSLPHTSIYCICGRWVGERLWWNELSLWQWPRNWKTVILPLITVLSFHAVAISPMCPKSASFRVLLFNMEEQRPSRRRRYGRCSRWRGVDLSPSAPPMGCNVYRHDGCKVLSRFWVHRTMLSSVVFIFMVYATCCSETDQRRAHVMCTTSKWNQKCCRKTNDLWTKVRRLSHWVTSSCKC